jgi:eukaryotic-like serine/threonine-protein kinase
MSASPGSGEGRLSQQIQLTPLSRKTSEQLVRRALGDAADADLTARLVECADGNTFFLEEPIRAVAQGTQGGLPETLVTMVQAELEALGA